MNTKQRVAPSQETSMLLTAQSMFGSMVDMHRGLAPEAVVSTIDDVCTAYACAREHLPEALRKLYAEAVKRRKAKGTREYVNFEVSNLVNAMERALLR